MLCSNQCRRRRSLIFWLMPSWPQGSFCVVLEMDSHRFKLNVWLLHIGNASSSSQVNYPVLKSPRRNRSALEIKRPSPLSMFTYLAFVGTLPFLLHRLKGRKDGCASTNKFIIDHILGRMPWMERQVSWLIFMMTMSSLIKEYGTLREANTMMIHNRVPRIISFWLKISWNST